MKKLSLIALIICVGFSAFAGGAYAKSNLSTGWIRNPSRNTESKRADSSIYNIAGTAFVNDGLYFELGNQFVFKEYSHKVNSSPIIAPLNDEKFKEDEPIYLFPDFVALYKRNRWAASFNFTVISGGGTVNYKTGTATTAAMLFPMLFPMGVSDVHAHSVKVKSVVYGETLTFAYKPLDWISISAGIRLAESTQEMKVKCNEIGLNGGYKATGIGFGGIFGIHLKPIEQFDFSFQYKTKVGIEMKEKDVDAMLSGATGGKIANDRKFDCDIPSEIQVGVGYRIINPLYVSASFGYYFAENAHQYSALGEDKWNNSWNIQAGIEYDVTPRLCLSLGYNHGKEASDNEKNSVFSPVVEVNAFSAGAEFKFSPKFIGAIGIMYNVPSEKSYSSQGMDFTLKSQTVLCSVGFTVKPF